MQFAVIVLSITFGSAFAEPPSHMETLAGRSESNPNRPEIIYKDGAAYEKYNGETNSVVIFSDGSLGIERTGKYAAAQRATIRKFYQTWKGTKNPSADIQKFLNHYAPELEGKVELEEAKELAHGVRKWWRENGPFKAPWVGLVRTCNSCHKKEINAGTRAPEIPSFVEDPQEWGRLLKAGNDDARKWLSRLSNSVVHRHRMPPEGWAVGLSHDKEKEIESSLSALKEFLTSHKETTDPAKEPVSQKQVQQILPPDWLKYYRSLVKEIATDNQDLKKSLAEILEGKNALLYDRQVMPQLYQSPQSAQTRLESAVTNGAAVVGGHGTDIFTNGEFRHPFGRGFGIPFGTRTFFAMVLPKDSNGDFQKIKIKVQNIADGTTGGRAIQEWTWAFPPGTKFFEFVVHDDRIAEVRERQLLQAEDGSVATLPNIFRQFSSKATFIQQIKALRPAWEKEPKLKALIEGLGETNLQANVVGDGSFKRRFDFTGYQETLPTMPADLVADLRKSAKFVSSAGTYWSKDKNGNVSFAPTAADDHSIVPKGYQAHAFSADSKTCMQCHNQTGRTLDSLYPEFGLLLYGNVWGGGKDSSTGNGIFSWHPFDPSRAERSRVIGNGVENRQLRSEFSTLVEFSR